MTKSDRENTSPTREEASPHALSKARAVLRLLIAAALLAACALWLPAALGQPLYLADLAANATAQAGFAAALFAIWWLIRRRWIAASIATTAVLLALLAVAPGRHLTTQSPIAPEDRIRILLWNANPNNENREAVKQTILEADADIVALLESPLWLIEELKAGDAWRERYPHYFMSERAANGFKVVLTRWPQHSPSDLRRGERFTLIGGNRTMILDRPAGPFGFILMHPLSPRNAERWRKGAQLIRETLARTNKNIRDRGLEFVAVGDLNAAPATHRTRLLSAAGLRRAKPLLTPVGTIPGNAPWPFSVAIDDAVVTRDTRVLAWKALPAAGSDHRPILIDLEIRPPTNPIDLRE